MSDLLYKGKISSRILIGSSPDSGSTLLALMIDSHPQMYCGPETNLFAHPAMWSEVSNIAQCLNLPNHPVSISEGITWVRPSSANLAYHLVSLNELRENATLWQNAMKLYDYVMKPRLALEKKIVACEISTLNNYSIIPALSAHPEMKAIVIVRNVQDVIISLARRKTPPVLTIARWLSKVNLGHIAHELFGQDRVLLIKYEDLIGRPDIISEKICTFAGVDHSGAREMESRTSSLRLTTDTTISGETGASSQWKYFLASPIRNSAARRKREALPDGAMRLLNSIKLRRNALKPFGGRGVALDARSLSKSLGYSVDWDTRLLYQNTLPNLDSQNRMRAFCSEMITLKYFRGRF